jgi:hypothetical protein
MCRLLEGQFQAVTGLAGTVPTCPRGRPQSPSVPKIIFADNPGWRALSYTTPSRLRIVRFTPAVDFRFPEYCNGGMRWCSSLRHCATSRKGTKSIPDGVIGTSNYLNPEGGFTHSMPCPCRSPAMPCVNSHMLCRAPALFQQCRVLRESPRGSRKYPNC